MSDVQHVDMLIDFLVLHFLWKILLLNEMVYRTQQFRGMSSALGSSVVGSQLILGSVRSCRYWPVVLISNT